MHWCYFPSGILENSYLLFNFKEKTDGGPWNKLCGVLGCGLWGKHTSSKWQNTSKWVLTSFVFLTSFRFMSSFAFLNFFVGLTSLDFELFWCLMLFVLFCCLTSLVLYTLSKKCVRLLTFFYRNFFVPFYFCFQVHSVFMFCVFMELFQILL